jgi:hypothetical protein
MHGDDTTRIQLIAALARQPAPVRRCPRHGLAMSGGPVLYHCPAGQLGHSVTAAHLQDADEAAMMMMMRRPAA